MAERLLFGVIPVYGVLISLGVLLAVILMSREEKRLNLPKDIAIDMALWLVPAAVVGARLYYVAFQWPLYADNPLRILYVWEGGLAIYGGVIGGALAGLILAKVRKIPYAVLADLVAPVLILGQAIGRWGNFINGEAYGYLVENPAWQFFPAAVFVDGAWHMATFFYESLWDFAGFLLLWRSRKRVRQRGSLFLGYLTWYGAGRTIIEGLRTDSLYWGPFRVSQVLSLGLCLVGAAALLTRYWKGQRTGAPDANGSIPEKPVGNGLDRSENPTDRP